jgi:hypothetical protein
MFSLAISPSTRGSATAVSAMHNPLLQRVANAALGATNPLVRETIARRARRVAFIDIISLNCCCRKSGFEVVVCLCVEQQLEERGGGGFF